MFNSETSSLLRRYILVVQKGCHVLKHNVLSINLSTTATRIEIERVFLWTEGGSVEPKRSRKTRTLLHWKYTDLQSWELTVHILTTKKSKDVLQYLSFWRKLLSLSLNYTQCPMFSMHNTRNHLGNNLWRHNWKCVILNVWRIWRVVTMIYSWASCQSKCQISNFALLIVRYSFFQLSIIMLVLYYVSIYINAFLLIFYILPLLLIEKAM